VKDVNDGRGGRPAYGEPPAHAPNAALMIDFDNVTMGIRSDLQNQLRKLLNSEIIKGKVAVQRAYADWRRYPQYIVPLSEASIDLIFAPAFGSNKKNATDIRLAIDALELVFTRPEIGTFILLSGDSDFSSLVLKLKEYGKYIIGVGLRESSSDLLIQNCDEYYAYTELTGLKREGEGPVQRRDPWELVVEAVLQMKGDDDVMRSDRLKQVMQTLDANFDEKDAGFSRFSRFVIEAAQRGLLSVTKLENGQFAVDIGENANVPPGEERPSSTDDAPPKPRRRRTPARKPASATLTLAEAFDLLRQTLLVLGAVEGERTAAADAVRTKMVELYGDESDPLFERPRFRRLLRQAHDAHLIELAKSDDGGYLARLGPDAMAEESEAPTEADSTEKKEPPAEEAKGSSRRGGRSRSTTRRAAKGRSRSDRGGDAAPEAESATAASTTKTAAAEAPTEESETTAPKRRRNPRYRRGSRAPEPKKKAATEAEPAPDSDAAEAKASAEQGSDDTAKRSAPSRRRSVRGRGGSRGGRRATPKTEPKASGASEAKPARTRVTKAKEKDAPDVSGPPAGPEPGPPAAPKEDSAAQGSLFNDAAEKGGLLQRMSAAIRKVVEGPPGPDQPE
jgi:uncharacterized protein (TIGR00288 family)